MTLKFSPPIMRTCDVQGKNSFLRTNTSHHLCKGKNENNNYGKRQVLTDIFHNGPISMNGNTSDPCTCLFNTYPFTSVSINSVNNYGIIYSDLKLSPSCGKKEVKFRQKALGIKLEIIQHNSCKWK